MFEWTSPKECRAHYEKCRYRDRIDLLAGRLNALGYYKPGIPVRVREWLRFTKYCEDAGLDVPVSFHSPDVETYLRRRFPEGRQNRRFVRATLRIFIEADGQGNFSRRVRPPAKPMVAIFNEWVVPYLRFLREHRGLSDGTLCLNMYSLHEFTEFVNGKGISDLCSLSAHHIHDFCSNRGSRRPSTWLWCMSHVRCFLKYVFSHGGLQRDLSLAVGGAKHFRYARVPDVLTESDFDKLLSHINRSSPTGRRDYAVILLAARYGMRPSDIRQLRLDDIHWRDNYIAFRQSKMGKDVTLPLLAEISEALIDYLRAGRPSTLARNVFVRHLAPFEPFSSKDGLSDIMFRALRRAGLNRRPGSRGLYVLRHTLATRMLRAQIPMKTIGDVLGHATMNSTFVYTKVDVSALSSASLSIAEVLS